MKAWPNDTVAEARALRAEIGACLDATPRAASAAFRVSGENALFQCACKLLGCPDSKNEAEEGDDLDPR